MAANDTSALLQTLLHALREDLKPELQSANARHRAELIDMLLARLAMEMETSPERDGAPPLSRQELDALARGSHPGSHGKEALDSRITAFASAEKRSRSRGEARVAEISAQRASGGGSSEELQIPAQKFTAYLRQKFPQDPAIEATSVTVVPGGRSKGTLLLNICGREGERELVVRLDFSSMVTGVSVAYEFPVVSALHAAGVSVPEPLWLETDPSLTGGVFVVYGKVPGQAMGTMFGSTAPPGFVKQYAATLARVHAMDIDTSKLADRLTWGDSGHPVRAMVDSFYRRYSTELPPIPLLDTAFAWLYLQLETIPNLRVLVHGDAGLHNTMGENGELTSLLDWELAHAGHPAEDLCYSRQVVESILPWEDFLNAYKEAGGRAISRHEEAFFTVWRSLQLAIQCLGTRKLFTDGADQDLRIAAIGYNTLPKFLNLLASDLESFTATQATLE